MTKKIIAWDLGATKCTAGIIEYNENTQDLVCLKHHTVKLLTAISLEDLIQQMDANLGLAMAAADAICIGAAGWFDGETLTLENPYPYPMHFAAIARQQRWPNYAVIHDYATIVCSTFTSYMSSANNVRRLNSSPLKPQGRRVAFGIGTSLGLKDGVLFANGDFWLGENEMGHIGFTIPPSAEAAEMQRHQELMDFLHKEKQSLTFEKILSGIGTVRLHQFFYPAQGQLTPEEVGKKMRAGSVPELLDTFAWYIGLFVGTVQLSFMPEGGIWITGGVAISHLEVFDRPAFVAGINTSPAYRSQRELYPLGVLCNHEHALIGGGYYATKRLLL